MREINTAAAHSKRKGIPELLRLLWRLTISKLRRSLGGGRFRRGRTDSTQKQKMRFVFRRFCCKQPTFRHEDQNLLIIESTIKPKTCEDIILPILQSKHLKVEVCALPGARDARQLTA